MKDKIKIFLKQFVNRIVMFLGVLTAQFFFFVAFYFLIERLSINFSVLFATVGAICFNFLMDGKIVIFKKVDKNKEKENE